MFARSLTKRLWIGRKLVPKAIEVDAFVVAVLELRAVSGAALWREFRRHAACTSGRHIPLPYNVLEFGRPNDARLV
jgi:hypothetical protein